MSAAAMASTIGAISDNVVSDRDLLTLGAYANSRNDQLININGGTSHSLLPALTAWQQQPETSASVPMQTFTVPNTTQYPAMVQQISAAHTQQQIINNLQPMAIPAIGIPIVPTDALQQNLFVQQQQQQQHIQQLQQQLHLEQLKQVQQQMQYPAVPISQQMPVVASPIPIIHNLIPENLQASALAASMNGTAGYAPALILPVNNNQKYVNALNNMMMLAAATSLSSNNAAAVAAATQLIPQQQYFQQEQQQQQQQQQPIVSIPLTVQELPSVLTPVFNGVNLAYPGVEPLGVDPPIYLVRDFLTHAECDFLIQAAEGAWQPAPVVGKGAGEISPSRTSSTCFLAREDLTDYMTKVSALTSKPVDHCELPQVGRYLPTQQYRHHSDAFDLSNEDGRRFAENGGQRVVTVLVYLNDCAQGGQTDFPVMNLKVSPRKGTAVVFFPATVDGYLDKRALHAALPAVDTKYVSQVWIRQHAYTGSPTKRLAQPMINVSYS
ncbi:unnamed protein product [Pseudo-nitzschia multistriata]|uniref:Fe2OG dioxygenase domain-containing protein n=1 Tax=Pseudo-nitzschia multistriata TaxID=183589 RepID=A0A448ZSX1_9STRA|nr:unnamed protein product [Pseudo-nitzschia multistriata]